MRTCATAVLPHRGRMGAPSWRREVRDHQGEHKVHHGGDQGGRQGQADVDAWSYQDEHWRGAAHWASSTSAMLSHSYLILPADG